MSPRSFLQICWRATTTGRPRARSAGPVAAPPWPRPRTTSSTSTTRSRSRCPSTSPRTRRGPAAAASPPALIRRAPPPPEDSSARLYFPEPLFASQAPILTAPERAAQLSYRSCSSSTGIASHVNRERPAL